MPVKNSQSPTFYISLTSFYRDSEAIFTRNPSFGSSRITTSAMNHLTLIFLTILLSFGPLTASAQDSFSNCAAAFVDGSMVVDEYSPSGKSVLAASATGTLTVCTARLTETGGTPVEKIEFFVAIRDGNTGTLTMLTKETVKEMDLAEVMDRCSEGDHIVVITTDEEYALPHNEILIQ